MIKFFILLTILISFGSCEQRLYQAEKKMGKTPLARGIRYEEYFFEYLGNKINIWHLKPKPIEAINKTIIHFHGNSHNISYHFKYVEWLVKKGFDVFIFDYPGFGKSEGELSKKNIHFSSIATFEFIYNKHRELKNSKLYVLGQSVGGNIAITTLANSRFQDKVNALIVDSSFLSYQYVLYDTFKRHWQTLFLAPLGFMIVNDHYSAYLNHQNLKVENILITHGTDDEVVPVKFAHRIFENLKSEKKKIKIFNNSKHIESFNTKIKQDYLLAYLKNK